MENGEIMLFIAVVVILMMAFVFISKPMRRGHCTRSGSIAGKINDQGDAVIKHGCCSKEASLINMPDMTIRCYRNKPDCILDCGRMSPIGTNCESICAGLAT